MKKLIICIIVVAIVVFGFWTLNKNPDENLDSGNVANNEAAISTENETENEVESDSESVSELPDSDLGNELSNLIDKIYNGNENLFSSLETQVLELTDADTVNYMTGLENGNNLKSLVVSEPMMSSQAYSLVIAKVKDGVDADTVAKEMSENINMSKWICVSAEVLYATSTEDLAFLVMSSEEMAKPVYDAFKNEVGEIGEEYTRTEDDAEELPEDSY